MDQFTRLLGGSSQVEATKQAYDQQRAYAQAQNVPKELGFLDRIVGLRGGLDELHERLCAFGGRVGVGNPAVPTAGAAPERPPGLHGELAVAEERLRSCMQVLGALNEAF